MECEIFLPSWGSTKLKRVDGMEATEVEAMISRHFLMNILWRTCVRLCLAIDEFSWLYGALVVLEMSVCKVQIRLFITYLGFKGIKKSSVCVVFLGLVQ